jgi:putative nucleotidyltransferase with HDIG domain
MAPGAERVITERPELILDLYALSARTGMPIDSQLRSVVAEHAGKLARLGAGQLSGAFMRIGGRASGAESALNVLRAMREDGVLGRLLPEVVAADGVTQNEHHAYHVMEHLFHAAASAAEVRKGDGRFFLAALLHDIGKPATRSVGDDGRVHFYGHEEVGADMAALRLADGPMRLPEADREWVVEVIRKHMRLALMGKKPGRKAVHGFVHTLEAGVTLEDMIDFRVADKLGSGVEEKVPTEEFLEWIRARAAEPVPAPKVRDLAITGREVMEALGLPPGPEVGRALDALESRVAKEPGMNTRERLLSALDEIRVERKGRTL